MLAEHKLIFKDRKSFPESSHARKKTTYIVSEHYMLQSFMKPYVSYEFPFPECVIFYSL